MRYSVLNFIECPVSRTELSCLVFKEVTTPPTHVRLVDCGRINQPDAMFGPVPEFRKRTWLTEFLQSQACEPAPAARNYRAVIEEGLLISGETGRWYPIRNFIPELLPDHLRDIQSDLEFLNGFRDRIPPKLYETLHDEALFSQKGESDVGVTHKRAEMTISTKVSDPSFFGPGHVAPFNPGATGHTTFLIKLFSICLSLLAKGGENQIVLDAGCGYSWTTEWLYRIGFEPIGVDITRTYLDIAVKRAGVWLPHLILADTENLPIKPDVLDAILCYEAFHHIPERNKAMKGFFRALKPGKRVILAEPGADHEKAQVSVDMMERFGILERGMSLDDVKSYTLGTGFAEPKQHYVLEVDASVSRKDLLTPEGLEQHSATASSLFTIEKPMPRPPEDSVAAEPVRRNGISDLLAPLSRWRRGLQFQRLRMRG